MITLKNITKKFGNKTVFSNVNLTINQGDHIAVFAPSGGGKTTLANVISGVLLPDSGQVITPPDFTVSYMFQEDRLLPWVTAYKNVDLVNNSGFSTETFFKELFLEKERNQYPAQFSGGMKRRVALARALAFQSDLLILDEPLKGLDKALKEKIIQYLNIYLKGKTLLLISHDPTDASALCDKQFHFESGLTLLHPSVD